MTYQFEETEILIQPNTTVAGPFTFDLGPQLPSGASITDITVKTYRLGDESTSKLITGTPSVAENVVSLQFKYPGDDYKGKHKVTFIYTTDGGIVDEADFWCVNVIDV